MQVNVITLNAFASESHGGNPAGVVLGADKFNDEQMLLIAQKVGFSETAFIMKSDSADFKLRFFTPTEEVDLCGHATIGAFYAIKEKGYIQPGRYYKQETKAGILAIEVSDDGEVLMEQKKPEFLQVIDVKNPDFELVCESLGIKSSDIGIKNTVAEFENGQMITREITSDNTLKMMQVVSTGLKDLIIPVDSLETLKKIVPNNKLIEALSEKYGVTGYHVFTLETNDEENTAQCRNFAPLYGIDEESATGTASGALACFLYENNLRYKLKLNGTINMKFEQGYTMNKPSIISARIKIKLRDQRPTITSVKIGGSALGISNIIVEI